MAVAGRGIHRVALPKDELACPICYEEFSLELSEPKSLPSCAHNVCKICLQKMQPRNLSTNRHAVIECPICRAPSNVPPCGIEGLPTNTLVLKLIEHTEGRKETMEIRKALEKFKERDEETKQLNETTESQIRDVEVARQSAEQLKYDISRHSELIQKVLTEEIQRQEQILCDKVEGVFQNQCGGLYESKLKSNKVKLDNFLENSAVYISNVEDTLNKGNVDDIIDMKDVILMQLKEHTINSNASVIEETGEISKFDLKFLRKETPKFQDEFLGLVCKESDCTEEKPSRETTSKYSTPQSFPWPCLPGHVQITHANTINTTTCSSSAAPTMSTQLPQHPLSNQRLRGPPSIAVQRGSITRPPMIPQYYSPLQSTVLMQRNQFPPGTTSNNPPLMYTGLRRTMSNATSKVCSTDIISMSAEATMARPVMLATSNSQVAVGTVTSTSSTELQAYASRPTEAFTFNPSPRAALGGVTSASTSVTQAYSMRTTQSIPMPQDIMAAAETSRQMIGSQVCTMAATASSVQHDPGNPTLLPANVLETETGNETESSDQSTECTESEDSSDSDSGILTPSFATTSDKASPIPVSTKPKITCKVLKEIKLNFTPTCVAVSPSTYDLAFVSTTQRNIYLYDVKGNHVRSIVLKRRNVEVTDVGFSSNDNIIAVNRATNCLHCFSKEGQQLFRVAVEAPDSQFNNISRLSVDCNGRLILVSSSPPNCDGRPRQPRVLVLSRLRQYLFMFGQHDLKRPLGRAIFHNSSFYVSDAGYMCIKVYNGSGVYVQRFQTNPRVSLHDSTLSVDPQRQVILFCGHTDDCVEVFNLNGELVKLLEIRQDRKPVCFEPINHERLKAPCAVLVSHNCTSFYIVTYE